MSDWTAGLHWQATVRAYVTKLRGNEAVFQDALADMKALGTFGNTAVDIAVLEDRIDDAYSLIEKLLDEGEYLLIRGFHGEHPMLVLTPDFFSDPRAVAILKKYGLDPESLAGLSVKPMPF